MEDVLSKDRQDGGTEKEINNVKEEGWCSQRQLVIYWVNHGDESIPGKADGECCN